MIHFFAGMWDTITGWSFPLPKVSSAEEGKMHNWTRSMRLYYTTSKKGRTVLSFWGEWPCNLRKIGSIDAHWEKNSCRAFNWGWLWMSTFHTISYLTLGNFEHNSNQSYSPFEQTHFLNFLEFSKIYHSTIKTIKKTKKLMTSVAWHTVQNRLQLPQLKYTGRSLIVHDLSPGLVIPNQRFEIFRLTMHQEHE